MKKQIIYLIASLFFYAETQAQDILLSQPYNNALTVAPSFAGITNGGRAALTYRNQWAGINGGRTYNTFVGAADYFLRDYNSGIGAIFRYDRQGAGLIQDIDFGLQYNYRVKINRDGLYFRPGVQLRVVNKSLDFDKFVFSDQLAVDGSILYEKPLFDLETDAYTKLDATFSSLLYNKYFWAGFTLDHLIPYKTTFLGEDGKVPVRIALTGGINWIYKSSGWRNRYDETITFATLIQHQGSFNQMDLGATWTKNIFQIGLWYRGFYPIQTVSGHDAVVAIVGLNFDSFKVAYSYDISISSLMSTSAGSHEISLQFFFDQKERSPMSFFCR
jgi:type IX secretion system PorP/SprF family membrane protein